MVTLYFYLLVLNVNKRCLLLFVVYCSQYPKYLQRALLFLPGVLTTADRWDQLYSFKSEFAALRDLSILHKMSDYMDVDMDVDPAIVQIPVADQKLTPSEALLHGILIEQDLDFTPAACRYLLQTSGELRARLTSVASSDSFGPLESSDYSESNSSKDN